MQTVDASGQAYLEVLTPVARYVDRTRDVKEAVAVGQRPASLSGKRLAVIANWKPASMPFMNALALAVQAEADLDITYSGYPEWQLSARSPAASDEGETAYDSSVDEMASSADLMMSGVAD